jgi:methionyl-tRNA formyltransferase
MLKEYIVASKGEINKIDFDRFSKNLEGSWFFASTIDELNELLREVKPRFIFFPHWSWIVSVGILEKYECICFHMTDLPYGRGGSPLQNLIVRGYKETVISAIRMESELDTGPIYYKRPLSLDGTALEIFQRASEIIWKIIEDFVQDKGEQVAVQQSGDVINFKRRTPDQSLIPMDLSLEKIYDYIRMLDAPGYPAAFLKVGDYQLQFEKAQYVDNGLTAQVYFYKEED